MEDLDLRCLELLQLLRDLPQRQLAVVSHTGDPPVTGGGFVGCPPWCPPKKNQGGYSNKGWRELELELVGLGLMLMFFWDEGCNYGGWGESRSEENLLVMGNDGNVIHDWTWIALEEEEEEVTHGHHMLLFPNQFTLGNGKLIYAEFSWEIHLGDESKPIVQPSWGDEHQ